MVAAAGTNRAIRPVLKLVFLALNISCMVAFHGHLCHTVILPRMRPLSSLRRCGFWVGDEWLRTEGRKKTNSIDSVQVSYPHFHDCGGFGAVVWFTGNDKQANRLQVDEVTAGIAYARCPARDTSRGKSVCSNKLYKITE